MTASNSKITVATWNIGGGILGESHQVEGREDIAYYCETVTRFRPDILCLQEAHEYSSGAVGQTEKIAGALGYKHWYAEPISDSHLAKDARLSLGIASKFPILDHAYTQFRNPGFSTQGPNGEHWKLFDKGYLVAKIDVYGQPIHVVNGHCFPLHYFSASATDKQFEEMWRELRSSLDTLDQTAPTIVAIDLNDSRIDELLGGILYDKPFNNSIRLTPTTPKGIQQDYLLYDRTMQLVATQVTPTNSDHSYCEVELALGQS